MFCSTCQIQLHFNVLQFIESKSKIARDQLIGSIQLPVCIYLLRSRWTVSVRIHYHIRIHYH